MKKNIFLFLGILMVILCSCSSKTIKFTSTTNITTTTPSISSTILIFPTLTNTHFPTLTNSPTSTPAPKKAIKIDAGIDYFCIVTGLGGIKCWGNVPGVGISNVAMDIPMFENDNISIAAGSKHFCVLNNNGGVKCIGENKSGQLGNGNIIDSSNPVDVYELSSGVTEISAGGAHSCALLMDGSVKCWGDNQWGQLGKATTASYYSKPASVNGLDKGVVSISSGWAHNCVLMENGTVRCWGYDQFGELGDGKNQSRLTPQPVLGLTEKAVSIFAGGAISCSIMVSGAAKCWGYYAGGYSGKLSSKPISIEGVNHDMASFYLGSTIHNCGLLQTGQLKCWGGGPLGDGTDKDSFSTPVEITVLKNKVSSVSVSGGFTICAILINGSVQCWGDNRKGQVGDGTNILRLNPVDVSGLENPDARFYENAGIVLFSYLPPKGWTKGGGVGPYTGWKGPCENNGCYLAFQELGEGSSAKTAAQQWIEPMFKNVEYEILSERTCKIESGVDCYQMTIKWTNKNRIMFTKDYYMIINSHIIQANYSRDYNNYIDQDQLIDFTIGSIREE